MRIINTLKNLVNAIKSIQDNGIQLAQINLLWTNPNPSSAFAATTIPLDLSTYKFVLISTRWQGVYIREVGETRTMGMCSITQGKNELRACYASTTGVLIDTGYVYNSYGGGATTNNGELIPTAIYGIKYINLGGVTKLLALFKGVRLCVC